jgi:hypothetical protein
MSNPLHPTPYDSNFPCYTTAVVANVKQEVEAHQSIRIEIDDIYAVTFNPGRAIRGDAELADVKLTALVEEWSRRLDIEGLGFHGRRLHQHKHHRPVYVLVSQAGVRTWHSHGVALVPRRYVQAFEDHAKIIWKSVTPGGDMDMDPAPNGGWLRYITRDIDRTQPLIIRTIPRQHPRHH